MSSLYYICHYANNYYSNYYYYYYYYYWKGHGDHELVELFVKRHVRCDCGTGLFPGRMRGWRQSCGSLICHLLLLYHSHSLSVTHRRAMQADPQGVHCQRGEPVQPQLPREVSNDRGSGRSIERPLTDPPPLPPPRRYCSCDRFYDPTVEAGTSYQCVLCEDWFHDECIGEMPHEDDFESFVCRGCVDRHPWLLDYYQQQQEIVVPEVEPVIVYVGRSTRHSHGGGGGGDHGGGGGFVGKWCKNDTVLPLVTVTTTPPDVGKTALAHTPKAVQMVENVGSEVQTKTEPPAEEIAHLSKEGAAASKDDASVDDKDAAKKHETSTSKRSLAELQAEEEEQQQEVEEQDPPTTFKKTKMDGDKQATTISSPSTTTCKSA